MPHAPPLETPEQFTEALFHLHGLVINHPEPRIKALAAKIDPLLRTLRDAGRGAGDMEKMQAKFAKLVGEFREKSMDIHIQMSNEARVTVQKKIAAPGISPEVRAAGEKYVEAVGHYVQAHRALQKAFKGADDAQLQHAAQAAHVAGQALEPLAKSPLLKGILPLPKAQSF